MILSNIKALCNNQGISISQLERSVGLANATVRRWENHSPSVENLKLVADYLGVTIDDLLAPDNKDHTTSKVQ